MLLSGSTAMSAFAAPPAFATKRVINPLINGLLPFEVHTGDIDRDGDLDIYTANYSGRISWFENDGNPLTSPWEEHLLTEFADGNEAVVALPVDGDGDIDFFSVAFNLDEIAWYDNGGTGETWTIRPIAFDVRLATDVAAADLDGDGDTDPISASGFDGRIVWYENAGNNTWTPRVVSPAAGECVEAADLDQDGDIDVVAGASWHENDGGAPPSFAAHIIAGAPVVANGIAVLDVDRDGDPDLLTAGQEDDTVRWFENDGGAPPGWTLHIVSTSADFATSVYAADLDGDADMDILSASFFDDTIAWYENDGATPPSWTERAVSTAADGARSVFADDLDADGDRDVLSASQNDGKVVWHVNDADFADADRDGMRDGLDCAPADGTAFVIPRQVSGVRFRSSSALDWNAAVAGSGTGARYDVVRGTLGAGAGTGSTCLANDVAARTLTDAANPAPGTAFTYLVRASNACGTGPFGAASSGAPRNPTACP
jgi:hypothetical protein